ncbi:hypothetical protein L3Q82_007944 [Scortum barcoo]|uniref:Uncharacterized protein n=1 Tax=Scortum barcoo TaxID=214431 RepID=A0ACB8WKF8_9TELE|nr:hypothetical protein L3Q82_007944 [Scortum barcoo]
MRSSNLASPTRSDTWQPSCNKWSITWRRLPRQSQTCQPCQTLLRQPSHLLRRQIHLALFALQHQRNSLGNPAKVAFMVSHLTGRAAAWATAEWVRTKTFTADSGWNAPAIKDAFINGLNENIKDQLAPHETPEFEDLVVRIDIWLQERESERCQFGRRSSKPQRVSGGFREFNRSSHASASGLEEASPVCREEPVQLGRTKLPPEE